MLLRVFETVDQPIEKNSKRLQPLDFWREILFNLLLFY
jgi:hypothetical protein